MKDQDRILAALGVGLLCGAAALLALSFLPSPSPPKESKPKPRPWVEGAGCSYNPGPRLIQSPPASSIDEFLAAGGVITKCPTACGVSGSLLI